MVHGYKAFNADWTCRGKQYEVGKTYTEDGELAICEHGMHFCERLADCFNFYNYDSNSTKIAEVIAHGNVLLDDDKIKSCTDIIEIVRELPWDEVVKLCNTGDRNTGDCNTGNYNTGNWNTGNYNTGNWNTGNYNTGDRNTGDCNTGDRNTGDWNTGDRNTGDWNTGDYNTGDRNTGDWNTGDRNTGDCNTGDRNTGDWNTGDCNTGDRNTGDWNTGNYNTGDRNTGDWNYAGNSSGVFNTEIENIRMFNTPSDWTFADWRASDANYILRQMPQKETVEWISSSNMTDEEKAEYPTYKTTGGYLKVYTPAQTAQMWWDDLSADNKAIVMSLPNFDADVFEKCTGIRV